MIENALVFLLGMLVAGMIWLLFLPAFWRRAVRLTTLGIEQALPLSLNEIQAGQDRLRAEHGVAIAELSHALDQARYQAGEAKRETGERLAAESGLIETIAAERRRVAALEAEIGSLTVEIQVRDVRITELGEDNALAQAKIAGLEAQRDSLAGQLDAAIDLSEKRRRQLDEARVLAERAREAGEDDARRIAQLRAELQLRQGELREAERRLAGFENNVVLTRIRGGEETYQSVAAGDGRRQAS